MKQRFLGARLALVMLLGTGVGCGGGQRAVVPTGPAAVPKERPKAVPMIGPKLPQSPGK